MGLHYKEVSVKRTTERLGWMGNQVSFPTLLGLTPTMSIATFIKSPKLPISTPKAFSLINNLKIPCKERVNKFFFFHGQIWSSVTFLTLFLWRPDEGIMPSMLLGNTAYAKNVSPSPTMVNWIWVGKTGMNYKYLVGDYCFGLQWVWYLLWLGISLGGTLGTMPIRLLQETMVPTGFLNQNGLPHPVGLSPPHTLAAYSDDPSPWRGIYDTALLARCV